MLDGVMETLMGIGLASSAGLNAYIPVLIIGLLARYTDQITLPAGWSWLENPYVLLGLGVLLVIEMVVDKVPILDHANDVVQTLIRPTAGGVAFGAASTATTPAVTTHDGLFDNHQWIPIVAGIMISFIVHAMKAAVRPVVNVATAGFGAPVASTAEDIFSATMSLVAILLPVLIIGFLILMFFIFLGLRRRRRRRREDQIARAERAAERAERAADRIENATRPRR